LPEYERCQLSAALGSGASQFSERPLVEHLQIRPSLR
jgi:hypothetical protein